MQHESTKCFVYRLRSQRFPNRIYIGSTSDLKRRLLEHNEGLSRHTSKYRPWYVETAIWFRDPAKATAFEHYLKSGSGYAFSARHF